MSEQPKKKLMPLPAPAPAYVKLKVLKDLWNGSAFYRAGDEIEVFHHEAVTLLDKFGDHFEPILSE